MADQSRLAAIMARGRENVTRRVSALDACAGDLVKGSLDEDARIAVAREAHALAGTAGTFGLPEVSELARELEDLLRAWPGDVPAQERGGALIRRIVRRANEGPAQPVGTDLIVASPPILVVSENAHRARLLAAELDVRGRRSVVASDSSSVRAALASQLAGAAILELAGSEDAQMVALTDELHSGGSGVPVVILTPADDPATHLALIDAGAGAIMPLSTPVGQVVDAVERELTATPEHSFRIIAVDDDPDVLDALRLTLEARNIEVQAVLDPTTLLAALADDPPDMVVLDVDMPELNGLDLCRLIRANPRWRTLPVLFLSASRDSATVARVFEVGGDDYIPKPIIGAEVVSRVWARLERAKLHRLLAETDPLTGLANRRRLEDRVAALLSLSRRLKEPLSLAVLDADRFKRVNDEYGHAAGDAVLRHLAAHLTRSFRPDSVIARIGGEEFVIGLLGTTPEQCAPRLTEVLAEFFRDGVEIAAGERLHVSVSAGVACHPDDAGDFRGLYRRADEALLHAKESGRNRVLIAERQPATQAA
jgi:diguanylate cyclase (GGDEF)-like protein